MQARVLKLYAAHEEAGLAEAAGEEAAGGEEALAPHADHADPADAQARLEHAKALRAEARRLETTYGGEAPYRPPAYMYLDLYASAPGHLSHPLPVRSGGRNRVMAGVVGWRARAQVAMQASE